MVRTRTSYIELPGNSHLSKGNRQNKGNKGNIGNLVSIIRLIQWLHGSSTAANLNLSSVVQPVDITIDLFIYKSLLLTSSSKP